MARSNPALTYRGFESAKLTEARRRFQQANESDAKQCQRENDCISFEDGNQWPAELLSARGSQAAGDGANAVPSMPARPSLVIDQVKAPVRSILNQERDSDIGVELVPADDFGDLDITPDDTEIKLREGLTRQIQRDSDAQDARTWAYKRAVIAGRGYYQVAIRFLPGKTWDREVYIARIYNQDSVKLGPHDSPDGSDAPWEFVSKWVTFDWFIKHHPKDKDGNPNDLIGCDSKDFQGLTEHYPDWFKETKGQRMVRITDYYHAELEDRELGVTEAGDVVWVDEAQEGVEIKDKRTVVETKIKSSLIGGGFIELDETEWESPFMPIVKVIGDEVLPYDDERRFNGIVGPAMGPQRGLNYMTSKLVEQIGLTPLPLLQLDPDAIEGYEPWYAQINTRSLPYAPYRSRDDAGQELRPPMRLQADPNIGPLAASVQMFQEMIKSATSIPDPTLGNVDPALKSGKAINAVVANAAQSTSNFLDNLARSIRYEGRIINSLLYPVYGANPGRLVRIITGEGEGEVAMISDQSQPQTPEMQRLAAKAKSVAKLTKDAKFNVMVKVTRAFDSRRQQEATALGELISAEPQMMTWFGDLYLKNSDTPNRNQLADRAKVMLAQPIQAMLAKKEQGQNFDPQSAAQIAQLTQKLQELQQQAQQMHQAIETKQIENQGRLQSEQLKIQADSEKSKAEFARDIELQRMQDATQIRIAEINAQLKGLITGHELQHEAAALHQEQAHEIGMAAMQHAQQQEAAITQANAPQEPQGTL